MEYPNIDCEFVIIVPCKNEKGNIAKMAEQFCDASKSKYKLVYVVGESNDGTFEECLRVQKEFSDFRIKVEKQVGFGKFGALETVLLEHTDAVIVIWDGDNSIRFKDVEKCIEIFLKENSMVAVFGNRINESLDKQTMPRINFVGNLIFSKVASYVFKLRIDDVLCGLKVFPAKILLTEGNQRLRAIFNKDTFGDLSIVYCSFKYLVAVENVEVEYFPREYGSSKLSRFSNGLELTRNLIFAYRKIHVKN